MKLKRLISLSIIPSILFSGLLIFQGNAEAGRPGIPDRRKGGGTRHTLVTTPNQAITEYGVITLY